VPTSLSAPESPPSPPGLIRGLYQRFQHLVHEVGKFGVVGAICFAIDIGIFNLLLGPMGNEYTPKIISTVIAASLAFIGNRFWTWRDRARSGLRREYGLYFTFNAIGLGISLLCLLINDKILGAAWPEIFDTRLAENIAGSLIGVALASLFRFWAFRRFVFRHAPSEA